LIHNENYPLTLEKLTFLKIFRASFSEVLCTSGEVTKTLSGTGIQYLIAWGLKQVQTVQNYSILRYLYLKKEKSREIIWYNMKN